jgi:hypothetical protein
VGKMDKIVALIIASIKLYPVSAGRFWVEYEYEDSNNPGRFYGATGGAVQLTCTQIAVSAVKKGACIVFADPATRDAVMTLFGLALKNRETLDASSRNELNNAIAAWDSLNKNGKVLSLTEWSRITKAAEAELNKRLKEFETRQKKAA